jgi:hypothetical protein
MMADEPFAAAACRLVDGSEVSPQADAVTLRSVVARARSAADRRDAWRVLGRN